MVPLIITLLQWEFVVTTMVIFFSVMIVIWRFRINTPEYYGKITCCNTGKGGEYECVFTIMIGGVFHGF